MAWRRTGMRLAPLLLALALTAGCEAAEPPLAANRPNARTTPTPNAPGNFTLYVSNQSYDRPTVDIRVTIDGKQRVSRDFEVKNQHNWAAFTLDLARGDHELRATSASGEASLVKSFSMAGKHRWAVLDYWCCDPEFDEPRFAFDVLDRQPGFG